MEEQYEVICTFKDLEDNNHIYIEGKDTYPRENLNPTSERINELASKENKIGRPLIRKITKKQEINKNEKAIKQSKSTNKAKKKKTEVKE